MIESWYFDSKSQTTLLDGTQRPRSERLFVCRRTTKRYRRELFEEQASDEHRFLF